MAKINKDTLQIRIVELRRKANECDNKEEKAFLFKDAEYYEALLNNKSEEEVKALAEETKRLKDAWLKVTKSKSK